MEGKKAGQIRIATIDAKGIQGGVLKGHKATLKVLHVTNNVQLLVSVVDKIEDPSPSQGKNRRCLGHKAIHKILYVFNNVHLPVSVVDNVKKS